MLRDKQIGAQFVLTGEINFTNLELSLHHENRSD